jgi:menaquinone-specific isochorismate synthase
VTGKVAIVPVFAKVRVFGSFNLTEALFKASSSATQIASRLRSEYSRNHMKRRTFASEFVHEFLQSGWLLSYDSDRILVGWGDMQSSVSPASCTSADSALSGPAPSGSHPSDLAPSVFIPSDLAPSDTSFGLSKSHAFGCASLFVPDFYLTNDAPWRLSENWDLINRTNFTSCLLAGLGPIVNAQDQRFQWQEPDIEAFFTQFELIQSHIANEGLKKAVPVVFSSAQVELKADRLIHILVRLLNLFSQQAIAANFHLYGFWQNHGESDLGKQGVDSCLGAEGMIGATPELLFNCLPNGVIESVALAGTLAKSESPSGTGQELLIDEKERVEHQIVIEDLRAVLESLGSSQPQPQAQAQEGEEKAQCRAQFQTCPRVQVQATEVVELPTLFHLRTRISIQVSLPIDFEILARTLHPTPALGVAPRAKGFKEMQLWDKAGLRKRFGAPFGVVARLEDGTLISKCVVAIRNIQWQNGVVHLGSGCGVVAASTSSREWLELQAKRNSVKQMLDV